uniref:Uncharacterized protein n=1 Tax=Arundo donax TaxID=35708 RepID=A0A0A9FT35_ARUDO
MRKCTLHASKLKYFEEHKTRKKLLEDSKRSR